LRKRRILFFAAAILLGVLAGIGYGWWLRPQFYSQAELSNLRDDYRTDYILMTAEIYKQENNLEEARLRLQQLGPDAPERYAQEAVLSAGQLGYGQADVQTLADLLKAFGTGNPTPTLAESPTP
jgi:hypothetical protein